MAAQDTLEKPIEELESVVIRLAGDSGDGMQLTGGQFTRTAALFGNDISTLPDFPAEIRAPAGSLPGVSSFQLNFSSRDIYTPGRCSPGAGGDESSRRRRASETWKTAGFCWSTLRAFTKANLNKAGYKSNPLDDGSLPATRSLRSPLPHSMPKRSKGSR